jgi:GNAT superfamily N-acetyltransferase
MLLIQICVFDPQTASPERWLAYHAFRRTLAAELWPDDPVLSDAEVEYEMKEVVPLWEARRWLALLGADVVGSCWVGFRRPGTPDAAEHSRFISGSSSVRADMRRRGIGTLLLREVHTLMHELDKTLLTLWAHKPPGYAFLEHVGAVAKHSQVESRAVLAAMDWPRLRAWEATAESLGLTWEEYAGRVPRDRILDLLPVFTTLFADVPFGNLERAPITSEIADYDRWYERMDRVPGAHHLILLRDAGGEVAGLSDAGWDSRRPDFIYQHFTAVARPWRGRGLARALKARMLRQVHARHPEAKAMVTSNAETNAPMLSINARVGFAVHERFVTYQITREGLDEWRDRIK